MTPRPKRPPVCDWREAPCPSQPKLKDIEAKVEEAERLISELSRLVAELKQDLEKKND
jgi:uncharacterized coiled-coil protein SlyX